MPALTQTEDRNLTAAEVAEYLNTSVSGLYAMRHRGDGPPAYRIGRRKLMFRLSEVDAWIASRREEPTDLTA